MERDFHTTLQCLRSGPEQQSLETADVSARLKSLVAAMVFGVLVAFATTAFLISETWWAGLALTGGAVMALLTWDKFATSAIDIGKQQDRRYFLACLRRARDIEELKRAGLFAYLPASGGPEFAALVEAEVTRLKSALEKPPEWFDSN